MSVSPPTLGAGAAFLSSATWAYASARYAQASREVSPIRVNFVRMLWSAPIFIAFAIGSGVFAHGLSPTKIGWLSVSTLCSYAFADSLFFAAAKHIGVSSALAIASTYPLWAALEGTAIEGEAFGWGRAAGTLLCVGGVAAIIKLGQSRAESEHGQRDRIGVPLAIVSSFLWAGNTITIKLGATGLSALTVNSFRYTFALVLLGAMILAGRAPGARRPARGWLPLVPAVFLDCVIGAAAFIYALCHTDLAIGATLSSLAPLLALPVAIGLGIETISRGRMIAVVVTVAGIVLLAAT